ncbi:MAG: dienelactone hydrolase family protein [Acidobacteriota bacterium]
MLTNDEAVTTGRIEFEGDGLTVAAYEARPVEAGPRPALILIHEWWGVTPHIEDVARRYAAAGFLVVAPDLYDGVTTRDADEAARLMAGLSLEKGLASLRVVLAGLRSRSDVTAVGVTGFCMGGTFALRLACEERLEAAAPFYGDVPEETDFIARLSCPLLFIGGEKDAWITTAKMDRLAAALRQYQRDGDVRVYPGASHAFFNDTRPEVYSPTDAADAWQTVVAFLKRNLK